MRILRADSGGYFEIQYKREVQEMIASEIPKIINSFLKSENPYRCILIDGAWGIGKSFQIDKALKGIPSSISISLFGITTVDEIITQLVVKICSGTETGAAIANKVSKLSTLLGEIDLGPISSIGKLLSTAVSPQMVLNTLLEKSNRNQPLLIVFDDIERINGNLDMDLFLGIVETVLLKKENENIKVLFVANLEQMSEEPKNIWERYSEKLINRNYYVDDLANEIEFFSSEQENEAALSFLRQHRCKNLRTLQKAENFFRDVKFRLESGTSMVFQNDNDIGSLRFACYATVLECTEKIYEQEYERQKQDQAGKNDFTKTIFELENGSVEKRICYRYLFADGLATTFAPYLIAYFENGEFDLSGFVSTYDKFIKGKKLVYYMSDTEVKKHIERITSDLKEYQYTGLFDLLMKADEVYIWSNVLDLDTEDIEKLVSEEVPKEYEKLLAQKGNLGFALSSVCAHRIQSSRMIDFLAVFEEKEKEIYVEWLIKQLHNSLENGDYSKVYQLLGDIATLFQDLQRRKKTDYIVRFSELFCKELLLPIGSISETQYYCCQRSYALAMTYFPEKYDEFLQEYKTKHAANLMFLHRLEYIKQDYDEHLRN